MNKYLFLDIDGVLCIPNEKHDLTLSEDCQKRLGKILNDTGAQLVITCNWRARDVKNTRTKMTSRGFLFSEQIVGITVCGNQCLQFVKYLVSDVKLPRGLEIEHWLNNHVCSDQGENFNEKKVGIDYSYCILDDEKDMLLHQGKYLVNTDSLVGLTDEKAQLCIDILNGNELP